jgi:CRISPR-associated protein Csh2
MSIQNREELLFLYEVKDCNPNGDPLDENKPRLDPETGVATVTDVRIKRTIRDYLYNVKKLEILVRDTFDESGYLKDGKGRCKDYFDNANISETDNIAQIVEKLEKSISRQCIDIRFFGCTIPVEYGNGKKVKKSSVQITGPVQFNGFNRSLHKVSPIFIQGTAAFASQGQSTQKSFREDHLLPYACIGVYGVINENAAETSGLNESDIPLLYEGLWKGTENLISRSKMGHQPLALMRIVYKNGYRIGDLAGRISLESEKEDIQIRSTKDYQVNLDGLVEAIHDAGNSIMRIEIIQDPRVKFTYKGKDGSMAELIKNSGITPQKLVIG